VRSEIAKLEAFTDLLLGTPVITGDPSSWFLEFKNQTRSAGSTRQVRNLVLVVKWFKNQLLGSPVFTGDPSNKIREGLYLSTLFQPRTVLWCVEMLRS